MAIFTKQNNCLLTRAVILINCYKDIAKDTLLISKTLQYKGNYLRKVIEKATSIAQFQAYIYALLTGTMIQQKGKQTETNLQMNCVLTEEQP